MKKTGTEGIQKGIISGTLVVVLVLTAFVGADFSTRKDAKAGNYNNALLKTTSPYIATFDSDMAPTKDFLLTTLPFFYKEKNVGFVQLPQSFINPDIFQYRLKMQNKIPLNKTIFIILYK